MRTRQGQQILPARKSLAPLGMGHSQSQVPAKPVFTPSRPRGFGPFHEVFTADGYLAHWSDDRFVRSAGRPLGIQIKFPDRVYCIAEELYSVGSRVGWGENVEDASAQAEFTERCNRLLAQISARYQQIDQ